MTTTLRTSNLVVFFIAALASLFLASCAGVGSANTTSLLTAAGFRAHTPQTPKQQQIYAALPPYQVERAAVPGKGVFYVYKDEKAGLAYIGREQEYQRYQQSRSAADRPKLLHGGGNGTRCGLAMVRGMGTASFLVVNETANDSA